MKNNDSNSEAIKLIEAIPMKAVVSLCGEKIVEHPNQNNRAIGNRKISVLRVQWRSPYKESGQNGKSPNLEGR